MMFAGTVSVPLVSGMVNMQGRGMLDPNEEATGSLLLEYEDPQFNLS